MTVADRHSVGSARRNFLHSETNVGQLSLLIRSLSAVALLDSRSPTLSARTHRLSRGRTNLVPAEGLRMSRDTYHVPVMVEEVLELLRPIPEGLIIDATIGGGGHARAILEAFPSRTLLGVDRDPVGVAAAAENLASFEGRVKIHRAEFDQISELVHEGTDATGEREPIAAVFFDLGVSSRQLDDAARGFSYRNDGPLDMRMNPESGISASEFLEGIDESSLVALLIENGEGRFARRIARSILVRRPIRTTLELAEAVSSAVPVAARRRGHPARRVFQALRIAVNRELDLLGPAINTSIDLLVPGGRLVVLAYHSGEDRIVKEHLVNASTGGCQCPPGLPCVCGAVGTVRLLNRGARKATAMEIAANPRAESVRLRAAERLVSSPSNRSS